MVAGEVRQGLPGTRRPFKVRHIQLTTRRLRQERDGMWPEKVDQGLRASGRTVHECTQFRLCLVNLKV